MDVPLADRMFIVGPTASGKSNLLDVFRFLRDIAKSQGGGLQLALARRGGIQKIRCLSARRNPLVEIDLHLEDGKTKWRYSLSVRLENKGRRRTLLETENVWKNGRKIVSRPDEKDEKDDERLTLTFLESPTTNANFRDIAEFLGSVSYLHLVPQLLRETDSVSLEMDGEDNYGKNFLVRVAKTRERDRKARLKKIIGALKIAVPQFEEIGRRKMKLASHTCL